PRVTTLSLHDALPIYREGEGGGVEPVIHKPLCNIGGIDSILLAEFAQIQYTLVGNPAVLATVKGFVMVFQFFRHVVCIQYGNLGDRKSTRLNSSHVKS